MRNKERLDNFYDELKQIHKEYFPDWRFGQLCSNMFGWIMKEKKIDIFFPEEDKMLEILENMQNYFKERVKMKNKIIAILMAGAIALSLTACDSSVVNSSDDAIEPTAMFDRHTLDDWYSIIVDKETGVCYLEMSGGYQYGITVMLNTDGTPKIWEKK